LAQGDPELTDSGTWPRKGAGVATEALTIGACPLPPYSAVATWTIVLGPALVVATLATIQLPGRKWIGDNFVTLEWLQHLALHGAFYGFALVVLLGLRNCEPRWIAHGFVLIYVIATLGGSWLCGWRIHTLRYLHDLKRQAGELEEA
jgi:hypothetical protein